MFTDPHFVDTGTKVDAIQTAFPMYEAVMEHIGNPVVFNICMLGCLIGFTNLLKPESIMLALKHHIAPRFIEMNQDALQLGFRLAQK